MKFLLNAYFLLISIILFPILSIGQTTFSKLYNLNVGQDNFALELYQLQNELIIATGHICFSDSLSCGSIISLDREGNLNQSHTIPDILFSNNNIINIVEDSIKILALNESNNHNSFYVLSGDMNLNNFNRKEYELGQNTLAYLLLGVLKHQENYFTYGQTVENGIGYGHLIKWDASFNSILKTQRIHIGDSFSSIDKLQATPDGNMDYINGSGGSTKSIVKIDTAGNILKEFSYETLIGNMIPNLLVSKEGAYYFPEDSDPTNIYGFGNGHIAKISNTLEEYEWILPLSIPTPEDYKVFAVYDIIEAQNGDLLVCGRVFDEDVNDSEWSGFICRISPNGDLNWLKMYKTANLINPAETRFYRPSALLELEETPDGGILAIGICDQRFVDEFTLSELWVLSVDENGCIDEDNCEETILTSTNNLGVEKKPAKSEVLIYPNPSSTSFDVWLKEDEISKINVCLISGQIIQTYETYSNRMAIDVSTYTKGIYIVEIISKSGRRYLEKVVVN